MNSTIKLKNNQFILPIINPCPMSGDIPVLKYNDTSDTVGLVKVDANGAYFWVCDYTTRTEENVMSMIKRWNEATLQSDWNDIAIDRHLVRHRNYLLISETLSSILSYYPSIEMALEAKNTYEQRFNEKCKILVMHNNSICSPEDLVNELSQLI
jgi:hypothetical protein